MLPRHHSQVSPARCRRCYQRRRRSPFTTHLTSFHIFTQHFKLTKATLLSVPFFPTEDSKLRATSLATRRGGNCPNALQVLQQLLRPPSDVQLHLLSVLPGRYSSATRSIASSFAGGAPVDLSYCVYRESHDQAASSYILRSEATGTRTLVSYNDLPEMTVAEFEGVISAFRDDETWWHFEVSPPPFL